MLPGCRAATLDVVVPPWLREAAIVGLDVLDATRALVDPLGRPGRQVLCRR